MKHIFQHISILFWGLLLFPLSAFAQKPYINEIFYDTPLEERGFANEKNSTHNGEYIEIYNPANQEVNITGWLIQAGAYGGEIYKFSTNTIIPARGYLIVVSSTGNFKLSHLFEEMADLENKIQYHNDDIVLYNNGEIIKLVDNNGDVVDWMAYKSKIKDVYPPNDLAHYFNLYAYNGTFNPNIEQTYSSKYLVSLHRKEVLRDSRGNGIFDIGSWQYGLISPFETKIESSYTVNAGGELIPNPGTPPDPELKNYLLSTSFAYNIRSWMTEIVTTKQNKDFFSLKLDYNKQTISGNTKPQWGGNVSSMSWNFNATNKVYNFAYDELSRLTEARYKGVGNYSSSYTYDKHGNITNIERYGDKTLGIPALIDDISLDYTGNQLTSATNYGTGSLISESANFKDYNDTPLEYSYNANGAMTQDLNKGIQNIQYNSLNLPISMTINNLSSGGKTKGTIDYIYTATGVKLQTVHRDEAPSLKHLPIGAISTYGDEEPKEVITDYVGNLIFEDGELKRILVDDGGYLDMDTGEYHLYVTDHLGNNRAVVKEDGTVVQKTHYYPFGMAFASSEGQENQPYKYNGKELDTKLELNNYDYAARYMDPAIGRFTTVDPHAENYFSWSPYAYVGNNPMRLTDPTGMDWYRNDDHTAYIWRSGNDESFTHTIGQGDDAITMTMTNIGDKFGTSMADGSFITWNQNEVESIKSPPSLDQSIASTAQLWANSDGFLASFTYGIANDAYVTVQGFANLLTLGSVAEVNEYTGRASVFKNLDGTDNTHAVKSLVNTAPTMMSGGAKLGVGGVAKGLGHINKLNAAQFSSKFKGSLSTMGAKARGTFNNAYNSIGSFINGQIRNGKPVSSGVTIVGGMVTKEQKK